MCSTCCSDGNVTSVVESVDKMLAVVNQKQATKALVVINTGESPVNVEDFKSIKQKYPKTAIVTITNCGEHCMDSEPLDKTIVKEDGDSFKLKYCFECDGKLTIWDYDIAKSGIDSCFIITDKAEHDSKKFPIVVGEVCQFIGDDGSVLTKLEKAILSQTLDNCCVACYCRV